MIEVTLRFNSVEAMLAHFMPPMIVEADRNALQVSPVAPLEPVPPKRAARKKAEVTAGAAKVTEALNATVAPGEQAAATSVEAVEKALDLLFDAKGIEVARGVMARFGVKRGRELKPEQYSDFVKKCDAVVAGGEV